MDLLVTFNKILHNAQQGHGSPPEQKAVRTTQREIQKTQNQIAEIRDEQRHQFKALSKDDRRKLCEVAGLESLKRAWSTVDDVVSELDVLATSEKQEDSVEGAGVFGETNMQEERSRGVKNPPQLYSDQTKMSYNGYNRHQKHGEQAYRQWRGTDTVQIPHKRVEALRGSAIGQLRPHSSQPPPQQAPSSLEESESQTGPQAYLDPWLDVATIEDMLRQNWEQQQVLAADLKRSKEDILEMQEDIRRAEEVYGRKLPRVDVDIEEFLRAREVVGCGIAEEGIQEMEQGTEGS